MRFRTYSVAATSLAFVLTSVNSARSAEQPVIEIKAPVVKLQPAIKVEAAVKVEAAAKVKAPAKVEAVKAGVAVKAQAAAEVVEIEFLAGPVIEAIGVKLAIEKVPEVNPNDAMIQQFAQQYRPILVSELAFIRQVVDLAPKDRPVIKAAGEASLLQSARQMAAQQVRNQRPVAGIRAVVTEPASPRSVVRQGLEAALKQILTPEQWKDFAVESAERLASRKRAAIMDTVARLDAALYLSEEQREAVTKSISAGWQDKWEEWLMMYVYAGRYFPMIPDAVVVTHLTAEQRSVWSTLQKINLGFYERVEGVVQQDDWWGPEAEQPAPGNAVRVKAIRVE